MENQVAIEVKNVTKSFKVYYDKGKELKEKMLFWKRNKYENRVVLDDVSFTIKRGEAVNKNYLSRLWFNHNAWKSFFTY